MVDITHKNASLRKAVAEARIHVSNAETIEAIVQLRVPKGNVFEVARTAGLFGVKRTSDLIPDCHPLPIEFTKIDFQIEGQTIQILVEVHSIYKTGVEVEAMTGASITALTMYDMLKPIDKGVSIENIRLISKSGGKSDRKGSKKPRKIQVVVCSDGVSQGLRSDKSGAYLIEALQHIGIETRALIVIPDEVERIQQEIIRAHEERLDAIIFSGGTGMGPRDVTYETLENILDKTLPGMSEIGTVYGQDRVNTAFLGRSIAGISRGMLVMGIPGSLGAAKDYFQAWFPQCLHALDMAEGEEH
jgi:cyclic pyranopterin phosphate synthase